MGVGGIFAAFGATVLVIAIFSRMNDWRVQLPAMFTLGTATVVVGLVMFALGFLLNRGGRGSTERNADYRAI
jgi:hypothetical protein